MTRLIAASVSILGLAMPALAHHSHANYDITKWIELEGSVFLREKRIQGCSMGSNRFKVDMPKYVDFYQRGLLRLDEMITRRGRLEDVNEAFRAMKAGEVARTVLMFD